MNERPDTAAQAFAQSNACEERLSDAARTFTQVDTHKEGADDAAQLSARKEGLEPACGDAHSFAQPSAREEGQCGSAQVFAQMNIQKDGFGPARGESSALSRNQRCALNGLVDRGLEAAPAVELIGYSFAYAAGEGEAGEKVLDNVNLRVQQGMFCVLVGDTGSGKTTLLRSLKPELAPVGQTSGTVQVLGYTLVGQDGAQRANNNANRNANSPAKPDANPALNQPAKPMTPLESAQLVGYVMQDPSAQIVCDTVWHELAFGLENLGTDPDQMRRRVAEVAHFFGIEPWIRSKTEDLSGGQKQLVNLAAVLALRPRLLLLDEPTAQLDPNAVKQFLFMLSRVNRELGITVIMATHSPEDVQWYATDRIDLSESAQLGTFQEAEAVLSPYFQQRKTQLSDAETVLFARDIHFRFDRRAPWVLRGADVRVERGSVHALVGGNGCGKTTLLRCLAGVLSPQRGRIRNDLAASQALLPQDPKALLVCDTVLEELMEWASRCGYDEADARTMAQRFGLQGHLARHPFDLSGGQQQKLAIAKLLLAQPDMLFLDEPTKGLDPASVADLSGTLKSLARRGKTLVLVTHDLDFAFATADRVSMLFDGELACTEPVQDFFANNLIYRPNAKSRLFGLIARDVSSNSANGDTAGCTQTDKNEQQVDCNMGRSDNEGAAHAE